MNRSSIITCTALAFAASVASAAPSRLTINQAQSNVIVTLTLIGSSATDSSPVTGYYDAVFNSQTAPTTMGLTDFRAALTRNLTLNISFSILGRFNSNANNLVILYANPPQLFGPVPITAGAVTLTDVPTITQGTLAYNATGIVCTQLQSSGLLCVDNINLADQGVTNQTQSGTVTVAGGVATLSTTFDTTTPLDPTNPGLGSIRVRGTVVASGAINCPSDFNNDGVVDFFDYLDFVAAFATGGPSADYNGDTVTDLFDYLDFVAQFATGC
jgi:hypothetical protein